MSCTRYAQVIRPSSFRPRGSCPLFVELLEARTVPSFLPAVNYSVGENPAAVAVGDFDNDAIPDLVVTNTSDATLSVLLGNDNGSFRPAQDFLAGNLPTAVAVGDFNNDGNRDLVVANSAYLGVSMLLGRGDGSFGSPRRFALDSDRLGLARALVLGDFNRDGNLDVGAAGDGIRGLSVLLGNGDGTLQTGRPLATFVSGVRGLGLGDFNRDGNLDLATLNLYHAQFRRNAVDVFPGNGDGTFRPAYGTDLGQFDLSDSLIVDDFNRDGRLDVLTSSGGNGLLRVLFGTGDGAFQIGPNTRLQLGGYLGDLVGGDFNRDGATDVAFANLGLPPGIGEPGRTVGVLVGNNNGTFQAPVQVQVGLRPAGLAAADFNGDGLRDLASANGSSHDVSVLLNDADWFWSLPADVAPSERRSAAPAVLADAAPPAATNPGAADVGRPIAADAEDDLGILPSRMPRESPDLAEALAPVWAEDTAVV